MNGRTALGTAAALAAFVVLTPAISQAACDVSCTQENARICHNDTCYDDCWIQNPGCPDPTQYWGRGWWDSDNATCHVEAFPACPGGPACPPENAYNETNPAAIQAYCPPCSAGQILPASLSCHSAQGAWGPFGNACTPAYCDGCSCENAPPPAPACETTGAQTCTGGRICHNNTCVQCTADAHCPAGQVCSAANACVTPDPAPGGCTRSSQCSTGDYCTPAGICAAVPTAEVVLESPVNGNSFTVGDSVSFKGRTNAAASVLSETGLVLTLQGKSVCQGQGSSCQSPYVFLNEDVGVARTVIGTAYIADYERSLVKIGEASLAITVNTPAPSGCSASADCSSGHFCSPEGQCRAYPTGLTIQIASPADQAVVQAGQSVTFSAASGGTAPATLGQVGLVIRSGEKIVCSGQGAACAADYAHADSDAGADRPVTATAYIATIENALTPVAEAVRTIHVERRCASGEYANAQNLCVARPQVSFDALPALLEQQGSSITARAIHSTDASIYGTVILASSQAQPVCSGQGPVCTSFFTPTAAGVVTLTAYAAAPGFRNPLLTVASSVLQVNVTGLSEMDFEVVPESNPVVGRSVSLSVRDKSRTSASSAFLAAAEFRWTGDRLPGLPAGQAVTFTPNNANSARTTTAVFPVSGTYQTQVSMILRNTAGTIVRSITLGSPDLQVPADYAGVRLLPASTLIYAPKSAVSSVCSADAAQCQIFEAAALDEFGQPLLSQPLFDWSIESNTAGCDLAPSGNPNGTQRVVGGTRVGTCVVKATVQGSSGAGGSASAALSVREYPAFIFTVVPSQGPYPLDEPIRIRAFQSNASDASAPVSYVEIRELVNSASHLVAYANRMESDPNCRCTALGCTYCADLPTLSTGTHSLFAIPVRDSLLLDPIPNVANLSIIDGSPRPPVVTLSSPTFGQFVPIGGSVTVRAEAIAYPGRQIARVNFWGGPVNLQTGAAAMTSFAVRTAPPFEAVWTNLQAGVYQFYATATDSMNQTSTSAWVSTMVSRLPNVSLLYPPASSQFSLGQPIPVYIYALDPDGDVSRIDILTRGAVIGSAQRLTVSTWTFTWNNAPAGASELQAVAYDNLGLSRGSNLRGVIVVNGATPTLPPQIMVPPLDGRVPAGDPVAFQVYAVGTGLHYRWQIRRATETAFADVPGLAGSAPTLQISTAVTNLHNGLQARVQVSNALGSLVSAAGRLTVDLPSVSTPVITTQPSPRSASVGETVQFSLGVNGVPSPGQISFQWQRSSVGSSVFSPIAGATGVTYTTPALAVLDSGSQFRCVVTHTLYGQSRSVTSQSALLTVQDPGAETPALSGPSAQESAIGTWALFQVQASVPSGGALSYQWLRRDSDASPWVELAGQTQDRLQTAPATVTDDGAEFACRVRHTRNGHTSDALSVPARWSVKVYMLSPVPGSEVSQTTQAVTFSATTGVNRIQLFVDERWIADDTAAPFNFVWDARPPISAGAHVLKAVAFGSNGYVSTHTVTVTMAPASFHAVVISSALPAALGRGLSFPTRITLRNTGTSPWWSDRMELGAVENVWGLPSVALPVAIVPPQGTVTFDVRIQAPSRDASLVYDYAMRYKNGAFFGEHVRQTISVGAPPAPVLETHGPVTPLEWVRVRVEYTGFVCVVLQLRPVGTPQAEALPSSCIAAPAAAGAYRAAAASVGSGGNYTLTLARGESLDLSRLALAPGRYWVNGYAMNEFGEQSPISSAELTVLAAALDAVRIYPNPFRGNNPPASGGVTFGDLSAGVTIKIFDLSARHVRTLKPSGASEVWDVKDDGGDRVASGVYLYLITDSQGNKRTGKLAIIQ